MFIGQGGKGALCDRCGLIDTLIRASARIF